MTAPLVAFAIKELVTLIISLAKAANIEREAIEKALADSWSEVEKRQPENLPDP